MLQKLCTIGLFLAMPFCGAAAGSKPVVRTARHSTEVEVTSSAVLSSDKFYPQKVRTAVLSISGEVRTQTMGIFGKTMEDKTPLCHLQVKSIIEANPETSFKVYYMPAADGTVDADCLAYMRAAPNVKRAEVLKDTDPERCEYFKERGMKVRPCSALSKQYVIYQRLKDEEKADVYIHTRFDITLNIPMKLDELRLSDTMYVLRGPNNANPAFGNIDNQDEDPIEWYFRKSRNSDFWASKEDDEEMRFTQTPPAHKRASWMLWNSVSDYFAVGRWQDMSKFLGRYELFKAVYDGKAHISCGPNGPTGQIHDKDCLQRQEELLVNALITSRVRFAKPIVNIHRAH